MAATELQIVAPTAFSCTGVTGLPQAECQALVDLFQATNGPAWANRSGWLQTATPCTWFGVTCASGHVVDLQLPGNNLAGSLPATLGQLSGLQGLRLDQNRLTGSIPPAVGQLQALRSLNLDSNRFGGPLPVELARLANLNWLYLGNNQLTGVLPPELASLANLRHFSAPRNQLQGEIPPGYANWRQLEILDLGSNRLTGGIPPGVAGIPTLVYFILWANQLTGTPPAELCNLPALQVLGLSDNQLSGNIPACIGNLAHLQELYLQNNRLAGAIPASTGQLSRLRLLGLSHNLLTGTIPNSLFVNQPLLEHVDLKDNQLYGPIPDRLGNLARLKLLALGKNQLSGAFPASLGNLTNLEFLDLGANRLQGTLPESIGNLTRLRQLVLWECDLTGTLPVSLGGLKALQELYLNHNRFTGAIPPSLGNLTNAITVTLNNNQLTGELPREIGKMARLQSLHIDNNQLTGWLPGELGSLSNLQGLYAGYNSFFGPLPAELGRLGKLQILDLGRNQLTGPLPAELANLGNLRKLYLYDNQFSGSVPAQFGNLRRLEMLQLARNRLTGPLPASLGQLSALQALQVDFNNLSGPLPASLGNLANLEVLTLWVNRIGGPIPPSLGNLSRLWLLGLSENELTGAIPPELGKLAALRELHLHTNRLAGPIPPELGNLRAVRELRLEKNMLAGEIPVTLTALTQVTQTGRAGFTFNMLTASDPALRTWLDRYNPSWATTQTLPPTDVQANLAGDGMVAVSWTPVTYVDDGGGYEINYGVDRGGPYTERRSVPGKASSNATIDGLLPGTTYYFVVRTVTPAHADDFQQNDLASASTQEIAVGLPSSNRGDRYEVDDTCSTARPLPVGELVQEHTFHRPGDADWMAVPVQAHVNYRVEAEVPPGSRADVVLELYGSCSEAAFGTWDESFTGRARLEFSLPAAGTVFLRASNHDASLAGPDLRYRILVRQMPDEDQIGAVILVAGRYKTDDRLQPNIANVISRTYELFLDNGYDDKHIFLLSTDAAQPGRDAPATVADLRRAITQWALPLVGARRPLNIYIVDHGNRDVFYLDGPNKQVVRPQDLDAWLAQVENAVPGVPINVIIEACHAGSFVAQPYSISTPGRLVVTSTNVENSAYASGTGADFSDQFLTSLRQGYDVFNSFWQAREAVGQVRSLQVPWLDADGDAIPNEKEDFAAASRRGFHFPGTFVDELWPPTVVEAHGDAAEPTDPLQIQATIVDNGRIDQAWAVVYPPSYAPPTDSVELVAEVPYSVTLTPLVGNLFGGEYSGPAEIGVYRIAVYARDLDGLVARPAVFEIQLGAAEVFLPFVSR